MRFALCTLLLAVLVGVARAQDEDGGAAAAAAAPPSADDDADASEQPPQPPQLTPEQLKQQQQLQQYYYKYITKFLSAECLTQMRGVQEEADSEKKQELNAAFIGACGGEMEKLEKEFTGKMEQGLTPAQILRGPPKEKKPRAPRAAAAAKASKPLFSFDSLVWEPWMGTALTVLLAFLMPLAALAVYCFMHFRKLSSPEVRRRSPPARACAPPCLRSRLASLFFFARSPRARAVRCHGQARGCARGRGEQGAPGGQGCRGQGRQECAEEKGVGEKMVFGRRVGIRFFCLYR